MIPKGAEKAIAEHFKIPPNIQRLASQATWDLHYGPGYSEDEDEYGAAYPGFTAACEEISDWCDDALSDVWYDSQAGEVLDREPEGHHDDCDECAGTGEVCIHAFDDEHDDEECPTCCGTGEAWIEPEWEDFYHFETKDVKRVLFDSSELWAYI